MVIEMNLRGAEDPQRLITAKFNDAIAASMRDDKRQKIHSVLNPKNMRFIKKTFGLQPKVVKPMKDGLFDCYYIINCRKFPPKI